MYNISIVIPVFNEDQNISILVEEIFISLDNDKHKYEIILINDASTDDTLSTIRSIKKIYPKKIKIISNDKNLGQSLSIILGIKKSIYR